MEMKRTLTLVLLSATINASDFSTEVYLPFSCYHFERRGQNEFNPGIGAGASWKDAYISALTYKDSWNKTGQLYLLGYRKEVGGGFGLDIGAGYLKGSKVDGVAVIPSVFYRYEKLSFHVSEIGTKAAGFSFRVSF